MGAGTSPAGRERAVRPGATNDPASPAGGDDVARPETDADAVSEGQAPDVVEESGRNPGPDSGRNSGPDPGPGSRPERETGTDSGPRAEPETGADSGPESDPEPGSAPDPESGSAPDPESGSAPESEPGSAPESESVPGPASASASAPGFEPAPGAEPELAPSGSARRSRRFPLFTRDTARPEGGGRAASGDAPAPARQWPLLAVLCTVGIGLLIVAVNPFAEAFRIGTILIGVALLGGAVLRCVVPSVGMLAVRSRFTDLVTYGVLGVLIVLLSLMAQPKPWLDIPFLEEAVHFTIR